MKRLYESYFILVPFDYTKAIGLKKVNGEEVQKPVKSSYHQMKSMHFIT
jgi:hypothetical protein